MTANNPHSDGPEARARTTDPPDGEESDSPAPAAESAETAARPTWVRALVVVAVLAAVVVGSVVGLRYWHYSSAHISTNNATLTGDVVQIAPQVSGTVEKVLVQDNQLVEAGQLLVVLDDANYRAGVLQAEANLTAAIAQAEGAEISVALTGESGNAQISQAQAGVAQAADAIGSAQANAAAAEAQVEAARAGVRAAEADLTSAKAELGRLERDNERYQGLFSRGSVSAQVADQSAVAVQTARARAAVAAQQVNVCKSQVSAAEAQLQAVRKATQQAMSRRQQAIAQLSQARTAPKQVSLSRSAAAQARAHVDQARAALETAQLQLSYTRIYAPVKGRVSKKTVQQGALVQPGFPLMAIVPPPPQNIWITANYKETQATDIRPGQRAEIRVDGFPGRVFTGRVDSVASATGATFALLPPDNATGNFTKVVQRIPVKLTIDPNQPGIDQLRAGMSATVSVAAR